MIVCTYEDRDEALVGLKLLVLGLARHCPDIEIHAFARTFDERFRTWANRQRTLRLLASPPHWFTGWNVKPAVLLDRLDAGYDDVVWFDSDIVLTRDFRPGWGTLAHDVCVVAEEFPWSTGGDSSVTRTRAVGLEVGRVFQRAINSGVVRVTPAHRALVARWAELLARPDYRDAQARPIGERPLHQKGDQDALAALLGSRAFADVPVRTLRPPRDILHSGWGVYESYPLRDRLLHLIIGLPPLIHAIGQPKPWSPAIAARKSAGLSPYCAAALPYGTDLDEPAAWMRPRTRYGRLANRLTLGSPSLRDLPTALAVRFSGRHRRPNRPAMRAAVVVLGDLGRSPRMQYHALALAANDVDVDLIGEQGMALPAALQHSRIRIHRLASRRVRATGPLAFVVHGLLRSTGAALALLVQLLRIRRPDVIVVQTPPAIPTLAVAWAAARLRGARVVFDWHNLGWTLLAVRFGARHPAVWCARWFEHAAARLADAHVCVSEAMAVHLRATRRSAPVRVLRDRPGEAFAPGAASVALRRRMIRQAGLNDSSSPAVVLSPTSWTRDEDLDLMLDAADHLETVWCDQGPADGLVIVISGEGAGRAAFEARIERRTARRVHLVTTWVTPEEYPALVASADAGISLHRSSSGLDLPMKVCDLLGAGVPVCALDYGPTLREMLEPDRNALLFRDARELACCLDALFRTWPEGSALWQRLRAGARQTSAGPRWIEGWQREARATILPSGS